MNYKDGINIDLRALPHDVLPSRSRWPPTSRTGSARCPPTTTAPCSSLG